MVTGPLVHLQYLTGTLQYSCIGLHQYARNSVMTTT